MSPDLPDAIAAYFAAANFGRAVETAERFTPTARVHDEESDHVGTEAIQSWVEETRHKYQPTLDPVDLVEEDGRQRVTTHVRGKFPGSPIELDFNFTLAEGKIAELVIG